MPKAEVNCKVVSGESVESAQFRASDEKKDTLVENPVEDNGEAVVEKQSEVYTAVTAEPSKANGKCVVEEERLRVDSDGVEKDGVVSDQKHKPEEPSTPKRLINTLLNNFEILNSRQLTPSRKAAIDARKVARYTSRIEKGAKLPRFTESTGVADGKNACDNKLPRKEDSSGASHSKSTYKNKPHTRPAAPVRDFGQFVIPSQPGSPAKPTPLTPSFDRKYAFPESPHLLEPHTPESTRRRYNHHNTSKTPYSDPKSVTDTQYTSVYNLTVKSDTDNNSQYLKPAATTSYPNSLEDSSVADHYFFGKKYRMEPLRRTACDTRLKPFAESKKDHRMALADINSIPDTLLPAPLPKNVLSAKIPSADISVPVFPQLIEIDDAPPPLCYEDYFARNPVYCKRAASSRGPVKRKRLNSMHDSDCNSIISSLKRCLGLAS